MQDYLFMMQAPEGEGAAFADWLLTEAGPAIATSSDCCALSVNVAVPPPAVKLFERELRVGEGFDATMDLRCPDRAAFGRIMDSHGEAFSSRTVVNYGYEARLSIEVDDAETLRGSPLPGLKVMRGFFFHADLPQCARIRSWDSHVNLAKRIHGFARYVRYWIGEPVTEGAPGIGGATNLHFLNEDDFMNQYFTLPDGPQQISQDISHFIDRGLARVFTREYVLK